VVVVGGAGLRIGDALALRAVAVLASVGDVVRAAG
jgi:hypothetical protein